MRAPGVYHCHSVYPGRSVDLLADLARGMAALVTANRVAPALRIGRQLYEVMCARDGSLFDALEILRKRAPERDASVFFQSLAQKIPLTIEVPAVVLDRFRGCEGIMPDGVDGEPLVLCVHLGGIAISVPLQPAWDTDRLVIRFVEIAADGSLEEISEQVDNIARAPHAQIIIDRDRSGAFRRLEIETFWTMRREIFPQLKFGLSVEDQIRVLNPGTFQTVIKRIDEIHSSAIDWAEVGGPAPPWRCKVTPESSATMRNPALRAARCFPSSTGSVELFEWHARFGSAGRIHLRFDGQNREIEIGYIGGHLPLN